MDVALAFEQLHDLRAQHRPRQLSDTGVRVSDTEGLVDTAAEEAVMGSQVYAALKEELRPTSITCGLASVAQDTVAVGVHDLQHTPTTCATQEHGYCVTATRLGTQKVQTACGTATKHPKKPTLIA